MEKTFNQRVGKCARCGQDHTTITFKEFVCSVVVDSETVFTHWGVCPVSKDPILLRFVKVGEHK